MSARRPVASPRSTALPTLLGLLAAGVAVEGCVTDAYAQPTPPRDGGVRTPPPPPPPPPPNPPHTAGVPQRVHPETPSPSGLTTSR